MLEVRNGGFETTVQDYPSRIGMLSLGFAPAGPMDDYAFRFANVLVGNHPGRPGWRSRPVGWWSPSTTSGPSPSAAPIWPRA
jgi:hypothetical protein